MKIAALFAYWENEPWSSPRGWLKELSSRGHDIKWFNLYHNDGILPKNGLRKYSNESINEMHRLHNIGEWTPEVVLLLDYGVFDAPQYDKRYIPEATWVLEAGDCPQAARMHLAKAAKSDLVLVPDKQTVEWYRSMEINAHFWTHCADLNIFKPYPDEVVQYDCVTTCGPRGNGTTNIIKRKLGNRFFNDRYFWGEEYGRLLNRGKMIFQHSQYREVTRRVFEGMACGKMVITDRLPQETGMADLFQDKEDIVYFDNADDAVAKIKYYAEHEEERERIAANGFMKTVEHHSVPARIDAFEKLVGELRS